MLEYNDSGVNIAGSNLESRILLIVFLTIGEICTTARRVNFWYDENTNFKHLRIPCDWITNIYQSLCFKFHMEIVFGVFQ